MEVLYEDNHLIVVNKWPGEIVQGDKTGDEPLSETVKRYLKDKYAKPGNVYLGVVHRLGITKTKKANTSKAYPKEIPGSKKAILTYKLLGASERYFLLEIHLHTGRHHQIRCQLAAIGCPIKGDLKYGAPRSNPDGSICLHAYNLILEHPVSHQKLSITAPLPADRLWQSFRSVTK